MKPGKSVKMNNGRTNNQKNVPLLLLTITVRIDSLFISICAKRFDRWKNRRKVEKVHGTMLFSGQVNVMLDKERYNRGAFKKGTTLIVQWSTFKHLPDVTNKRCNCEMMKVFKTLVNWKVWRQTNFLKVFKSFSNSLPEKKKIAIRNELLEAIQQRGKEIDSV